MTKLLRSLVALAVLVAVPGLAPYQAAAQVVTGRVAGPSAIALPAVGVAPLGANAVLETSFSAPLAGSLTGNAAFSPALSQNVLLAPSVARTPAVTANASALALPKAVVPTALKPVAPAASKAKAERPAALVLQDGAASVQAAAKSDDAGASKAALDGTFEGSAVVPTALAVEGMVSASKQDLRPNTGEHDGDAPRAPAAPKSSLKRTFTVGFVAAAAPLIFMTIAQVVAAVLGYQAHPGYVPPSAGVEPTVLSVLAMMFGAAVLAPISEEAIFRGGLQGTLARLTKKLRLGDFVVPAVIVATLFVAVHEMSDPLLFGLRFVHAMVLAYVYKKEGILASMAAHGFFNGLLSLGLLFAVLGVPLLSVLVFPAAAIIGWRLAKKLRAQSGEVASGALTPVKLGPWTSLAMAALLILGFLFLMPNIVWPVGALALVIKAVMGFRANRR